MRRDVSRCPASSGTSSAASGSPSRPRTTTASPSTSRPRVSSRASSSTRWITWTACSSSTTSRPWRAIASRRRSRSTASPRSVPLEHSRSNRSASQDAADEPQARRAARRVSKLSPMRVLFYGTPEFALPTFEALLERHTVVAAIPQPEKPAGRGQRVPPPPVKKRAERAGVPVIQPTRLRDPGWPARLAELDADIAVVVAFGQILPKAVLDIPARGSINVHASLLPRYRGAAPVAWAIFRGETETGITTFQMDPGMDTGDILLQEATPIGLEETAGEVSARLADLGAGVLLHTLDRLDTLTATPQDHAAATLAPPLKEEDGLVRPAEPSHSLTER